MTIVHPKIEVFIDALEAHYRAARQVQDCEDLPDTKAGNCDRSAAAALLDGARSDLEDALIEMLDSRISQ